METQNYISIKQFCTNHCVPISFVYELYDFQLIEIVTVEDDAYLYETQIKDLEKLVRLHFDLKINLEGLDAIHNLLSQVESLKSDIIKLENKLKRFEDY
ncbi:chaperone modulator CbpM [Mariniflexile sp.]|uniref:chaperone modulator CbpM n=1 Tax=Mariniflexile sp. TaxID=1979402 RepID=UPI00356870EB